MPPTTSTPLSRARSRLALADLWRISPSWGNATSCRSSQGAISFLTSSKASTASRRSSQTSTWLRTARLPRAIAQRQNSWARCFRTSTVRCGFSSDHSRIPSSRVPLSFMRGWPRLKVESIWKCASTKGGVTRRPVASISRAALALIAGAASDNAAVLDRDIDARAAIGQIGAPDDQIEHQRSSLRNGCSRAAGARALRETRAMARIVSRKGSIRKT